MAKKWKILVSLNKNLTFGITGKFFEVFISFFSKLFLKSNTVFIAYTTLSISSDIGSNLIIWQSSNILFITADLLFSFFALTTFLK